MSKGARGNTLVRMDLRGYPVTNGLLGSRPSVPSERDAARLISTLLCYRVPGIRSPLSSAALLLFFSHPAEIPGLPRPFRCSRVLLFVWARLAVLRCIFFYFISEASS